MGQEQGGLVRQGGGHLASDLVCGSSYCQGHPKPSYHLASDRDACDHQLLRCDTLLLVLQAFGCGDTNISGDRLQSGWDPGERWRGCRSVVARYSIRFRRAAHLHVGPIPTKIEIDYEEFANAHYHGFLTIGWNFEFPMRVEQPLWQGVCLGGGIVLGIGCAVEAVSIIRDNYTTTSLTNLNGYKLRWPANLMFFIPGFLDVASRIIMIIEVVLTLREFSPAHLISPDEQL
jgi:hypothetical protein